MSEAVLMELALKGLNAGFAAVALARRQGMTNEEINERLDRVDAGGDAITVDEVKAKLDAWQEQLNAAKQIG